MTPAARIPTLLCFGDSNTHGRIPMTDLGQSDRLEPQRRWPGVARATLGEGWDVIEEGLPGRTTIHDDPIEGACKNGLLGLEIALQTHKPVDILTIMLGTNDLKARFSMPASDIALSVDRLLTLVGMSPTGAGNAPPRVLLISPPPILEAEILAAMFAGGAEKSHQLGAGYRAVAEQHGCAFLDAGDHVTSSPVDGVHFDAEQHARLGSAVAAKVISMMDL